MTTELATEQDAPTHKLIIKLEDGQHRMFYLNEKQAEWLAQNINSQDRFIVLPKTVDPDSPQFYPKTWATLERMSDDEIEQRRSRYRKAVQTEEQKAEERKKREDQKAVRAWIDANPEEFGAMRKTAAEKLARSPGIFHSASEGTQRSLVYFEAWGYAAQKAIASQS
jgi:hypothetical protein